jgi:hypothetical protein
MNSMHPVTTSRSSGSHGSFKAASFLRRLPRTFAVLIAVIAAPGLALAEGADGLPKGYASDELPALPASSGAWGAQGAEMQKVQDVGVQVEVEADAYVDTDPSALSDFRDPLTPYGTWVEDSTYGTVWVPSAVVVGADFAPYQTAGRWAMTDEGDWLWVSDYEWGHIPFHYGRWVWISGRGWSWIPGRVYAPAWVSWRTSDYGYIGWAPLAPTWYWSGGSAVSLWVTPPAAYVFCPTTYVFHRHVHTHIVRDTHIVRRIGAHSKTYRAAEPSVGGKVAGAPSGGGSGSAALGPHKAQPQKTVRPYPKGPSLVEAKVPESAKPQERVSHNPKAVAFATRSSTAKVKTLPPSARGLNGSAERHHGASGGAALPSRGRPGISVRGQQADAPARGQVESSAREPRDHSPVLRTPPSQPRYESAPSSPAPVRRSRGTRIAPSAPSQQAPSRATPSHSAPSHATPSAPVQRHSPSVSHAPSTRSAPSAAPASRPSVAPRSSSAPSRSSSSSPSRSSSSPSKSSSSSSSRRGK